MEIQDFLVSLSNTRVLLSEIHASNYGRGLHLSYTRISEPGERLKRERLANHSIDKAGGDGYRVSLPVGVFPLGRDILAWYITRGGIDSADLESVRKPVPTPEEHKESEQGQ